MVSMVATLVMLAMVDLWFLGVVAISMETVMIKPLL